jgi:AsmA protein
MKTALKWALIIIGALIVIVIGALLILPSVIDIQTYKPQIEKKVAKATGRPFTLEGPIKFSLFPWASVTLSDVHLGNPQGFEERDFFSVERFEIRVKLLPLFRKNVQIKRFILHSPKVVLERAKDGRTSWEGLAKAPEGKEKAPAGKPGRGPSELPIKSLMVGEFSITDGTVIWIDHKKGQRYTVKDVTLKLRDVSLDKPLKAKFSAKLDGKPLVLEGIVGPVKTEGPMVVDVTLRALDELKATVKGSLRDLKDKKGPMMDLTMEVSPFSPRRLLAALDRPLPLKTSDPDTLKRLSMKAKLNGSPRSFSIKDGVVELDDTKVKLSAKVLDPSRPHLTFEAAVDSMDLDRYLPPKEGEQRKKGKEKEASPKKRSAIDYEPLRKMILDGVIRVGHLKANGIPMDDLLVKLSAKDGIINIKPLSLKLYEGTLKAAATLDVRGRVPGSRLDLQAQGIQVKPFLKDFMNKDFIEGTVKAQARLSAQGDSAERIKATLNGAGEMFVEDGAIVGMDLAGMVRNVKAAFGAGKTPKERPRTDFSELHVPFKLIKGVFQTEQATLKSPLLRVVARGKADLVKETLDFYVKPKFVGTLKGQGGKMQRSGIMVPVIVDGTFDSPSFRPDIKALIKGKLPSGASVEKLIPERPKTVKPPAEVEEGIKGILKKALPFK